MALLCSASAVAEAFVCVFPTVKVGLPLVLRVPTFSLHAWIWQFTEHHSSGHCKPTVTSKLAF